MTNGLLCVHAHPDDETISTGGVLLRAAAEGRETAVVTCTGGELGEIVGAHMDPVAIRPRLGEVRRGELTAALAVLGAGEPRLLGYRDSGMVGTAGNDDPRAFWRADVDAAVGEVVGEIRALRPDVLVTYDAFGIYGHPDHIQAHRVALLASEACAVAALYPERGEAWRIPKVYLVTVPRSFVVMAHRELTALGLASPFGPPGAAEPGPFGSPDEAVTTIVDVAAHLERKLAALKTHASQIGPSSFFLNLPDALSGPAFGAEWFIRQRSHVAVPDVEHDLFAGL